MTSNLPPQDRRWVPFLEISTGWETGRLALTWFGFALATVFTYLTVFSLIYWFSALLLQEVNRNVAVFATALTTLLLLRQLYDWLQKIVDRLFFPDMVHFREKIELICHKLTGIDNRAALKQFLSETVPAELRVKRVSLSQEPQLKTGKGFILRLEMGARFLGFLTIGPRQSGHAFGYTERQALRQLQEQISLVLSGIQLAEAREAAEKTDQLKLNFLTNVSHELRTPLNTIINSTGLVADGALGEINEAQAEFLNQAVQGSEHLLELLNDILDITKIETGQLTLQPEVVNLREVVEEVLPMARSMLQQKPIEVKVELEDKLPLLMADRLRIRQVLLNLLSNAIKFTPQGAVKVRAWQAGDLTYVSVEDTGIGIPRQSLPLIFEDYQQLVGQQYEQLRFERRRHLGTGLGLSITKSIVELHGGQIWVESELERGTTFTFTLPSMAPIPGHNPL